MASFADTKPLVDDFCTVLHSDDTEQAYLQQLAIHKETIASASAAHIGNAKAIIAELQRRVKQAESQATTAAPSIDDVRIQISQLESRRASLQAEVARLRQQKDASSTALQALTQQMASLKQASATLLADHTSQVPRVKHSLSLYATISSIRWDYDSEDVAGYIAPPGGAPVRPFYIDSRTQSAAAVADRLWTAIGEATSWGTGTSGVQK